MKKKSAKDDLRNHINKKQLYLLTDDGIAREFVTQLLGLTSLLLVVVSVPWLWEAAIECYYTLNDRMLATAHRYAWWSLLGLLSSSCCALQLVLNAMSLGCAGFNTVLGPWRPTVLAWTCLVQGGSWVVAWDRPYQWVPTATATVVVVSFALLPEVLHYSVHYYNRSRAYGNITHTSENNKRERTVVQRAARVKGDATANQTNASEPATYDDQPSNTGTSNSYYFQMTNVGCSACLVTIHHALQHLPDVAKVEACLETSVLRVDCCGTSNDDRTHQRLFECLDQAGFPMEAIRVGES